MRYIKQGGGGILHRKRVVIEAQLRSVTEFIGAHCGEFLVDPYDGMQTSYRSYQAGRSRK